jgi:NAD(P)H-hydrate repair Nnr-like enzyme with NAD(P)H-hydrate dehydratase domain
LKNFSLFVKGERDILFGPKKLCVNAEGGFKRCGGIGDILSGAVATCAYWDFEYGPALASTIVRMATKKAYEK